MTKPTYIKSPAYEERDIVKSFTEHFTKGQYDIVTIDPFHRHTPDGIMSLFRKSFFYRRIFNDRRASPRYFGISFNEHENSTITIMPIGVYGVSNEQKMTFPLLINGFWRFFLTISEDLLFELSPELYRKHVEPLPLLLPLREQLITAIFRYYADNDQAYTSAMAWRARGKQSLTRRVAESLGYHREELGENEVYVSSKISESKWNSLIMAIQRWNPNNDSMIQPYMDIKRDPANLDRTRFFLTALLDNTNLK